MADFIRSIDDIIGHRSIISFLKDKIAKDKVPKIIFFNGNAGLGKSSIAKVLAIAVNGNKDYLYKSIIDEDKSTDCIKLFNMSSVGDEVDDVISELQNASFSSTGRKVVILDEAHGMTKKAQDAILIPLEYLPDNIYVFLCSTEISMLRESLKSRGIIMNLNNLSYNEIKQVIKREIIKRDLSFDMQQEMILNLIAMWSNNQPRKALNLIGSFDIGSTVTQKELSAFISTTNIKVIISIAGYLYGSLTKGIAFVDTLSITPDLLQSMIEVLKVGLGYTSSMVDQSDVIAINSLFAVNDINNYLQLTIKINSSEYTSKRVFTSRFIEHHISIFNGISKNLVPTNDIQKVMQSDLRTIGDGVIEQLANDASLLNDFSRQIKDDVSIDALFNLGQKVE